MKVSLIWKFQMFSQFRKSDLIPEKWPMLSFLKKAFYYLKLKTLFSQPSGFVIVTPTLINVNVNLPHKTNICLKFSVYLGSCTKLLLDRPAWQHLFTTSRSRRSWGWPGNFTTLWGWRQRWRKTARGWRKTR